MSLARRIRIARGDEPADLVLRGGRIANLLSGEIHDGEIVIADGAIVTLGHGYRGLDERELDGRLVVPGLIDGHMHLESTMLVMGEFARTVLPHGTTTVVLDPHEFANVRGVEGMEFVLRSAEGVPLDVYAMLSSCVPASSLESPHRALSAADLEPLLAVPAVRGLAEVMDVAAVLRADAEVLAKISAVRARGLRIDGHAPGVQGAALRIYAAAGIESDHESVDLEEAREKLRLGLWLMVREGSAARNLQALLPLLAELRPTRALFVTDDRDVVDLVTRGHIDSMVRDALAFGLDPLEVLRLASYNASCYFGLHDRGAIAPGRKADLLVLDDLTNFTIESVYKDGELVAQHGQPCFTVPPLSEEMQRSMWHTVAIGPLNQRSLQLYGRTGPALVIGLQPGQITTTRLIEHVEAVDSLISSDPARDLLKLVSVERHHASGRVGLGLVRGFGLRSGALASSVAHDAHNLVAVGADDLSLQVALEAVRDMGGGFVVAAHGRVLAALPLELGGLITSQPAKEVMERLELVDSVARDLGCALEHPFMTLSFLSLSVIPDLKLTDQGLVDVTAARIVTMQGPTVF